MEKIKVIITSTTTCKEVNRYQKLKYKSYYTEMSPIIGKKATIEMYHSNNHRWQEAESKLRTFEIEYPELVEFESGEIFETEIIRTFTNIKLYEVGKQYEAEIISEGRVRII